MASLQGTPRYPRKTGRLLQSFLQGSGRTLWNLLILSLPIVILTQGKTLLQEWIYEEKESLYFHSYADQFTSGAFVVLILVLTFFYFQVIKNGLNQFRPTMKRFLIPLILAVPLFILILDSYVMINQQQIIHSPFWSIGQQSIHSWDEVEKITVDYSVDSDEEQFLGTYILHFKDQSQLEIWQGGNMTTRDLELVDRLATTRNIPFTVQNPLSPKARNILTEMSWSSTEKSFLNSLYQRQTATPSPF
ncbi:hypothetical protein GXN76_03015 [Kroppenstedtia pulmonis]|uniref:Uncharacterized protein n=1 Tax=Kroppenstedtia pulmonis TaxID=1380685 RepID=A0A7D3Y096_9BACL|nr:hypothetical protein [Kroppenstedtia pulmonis]QKG83543.1 hypothetical protein GXN76_03015 [Kroppenstedtia pulmonis]